MSITTLKRILSALLLSTSLLLVGCGELVICTLEVTTYCIIELSKSKEQRQREEAEYQKRKLEREKRKQVREWKADYDRVMRDLKGSK